MQDVTQKIEDAMAMLIVGEKYKLVTYDMDGNPEPEKEWIVATWNGECLLDDQGCHWNEWLHAIEDIVAYED